ncbi:hypothetical protein B0J12DRAFT_189096 [Macrophomina phaseolina]|uniref:Uncharacterized protein n=1 Tax=Macrophomina phaseolina TaxID=35725 RepID=A0ABQ8G6P6_9PEZI|nr:hypothetical protein B0J12DRAFT_189096 [Macrophomina phaseolina]
MPTSGSAETAPPHLPSAAICWLACTHLHSPHRTSRAESITSLLVARRYGFARAADEGLSDGERKRTARAVREWTAAFLSTAEAAQGWMRPARWQQTGGSLGLRCAASRRPQPGRQPPSRHKPLFPDPSRAPAAPSITSRIHVHLARCPSWPRSRDRAGCDEPQNP